MKLGIIFYFSIFNVMHLTGSTAAYFSDTAQVNGIFQVATWWDKSSLEFFSIKQSKPTKTAQCTPVEAVIKNGGENMGGSVLYEVWWAETGNPKNGAKQTSGQIPALKSGESITLTYTPDKNGNYMFKAYQRLGHPGTGELWSNEIGVQSCSEAKPIEQDKKDQETSPKEEPINQEEPVQPVETEEQEVAKPEPPAEDTEKTETTEPTEETETSDSTTDNQTDNTSNEQQKEESQVNNTNSNQNVK
jgi:YqxM protein